MTDIERAKIPSEVDLAYREKVCPDCKKTFMGNDYHYWCSKCYRIFCGEKRPDPGFYLDD